MASAPAFAATPASLVGQMSTANTARDGTGTLATIFTPGANGSRINFVSCQATVTTAAGTLRFFIDDGTNKRLECEVKTLGVTVSGTVPGERVEVPQLRGRTLKNGQVLKACPNNSEAWNVTVDASDL